MRFRTLTSVIAAAGIAMVMMTGAVQAAEAATYPDWKGAWTRWFPPGSVLEPNGGFSAGGQPSLRTTKPSRGGEDRRPRSLLNIKKSSRKASRTRPTVDRGIFLTMRSAACPEACRS
jgi:hypothetical protein